MRHLCILLFFSLVGYSQSNEVIINQAVQTAKSQNIKTKSDAVKALEASGMTLRKTGIDKTIVLNQNLTNHTCGVLGNILTMEVFNDSYIPQGKC